MSITWIGDPFERARRAAEPAVEPTSIAFDRSAWLALFEPADWIHVTVTPCLASAASSQPCFLMIRLSGLYVAKSMLSVPPVDVGPDGAAPDAAAGAPEDGWPLAPGAALHPAAT